MTRAWVEIDSGALIRNAEAIANRAGVPLLPMVKADGYGTGGVRAAIALETLNPWGFGVATSTEGRELRRAGITRPIVVFTPILRDEIDALRRSELTPALGEPAVIESWARTGRPWHLQIDTGMSRAGMRWTDVSAHRELLSRAAPEGVFTHFHSAELRDGSRETQIQRFTQALEQLPARPAIVHAENGAAIEAGGRSPFTLCRPGVFLYGVSTVESSPLVPEPVVSVKASIVEMRTLSDGETVSYDATWRASGTRRIATIPVGYADGYRRALSNRGVGLLHGKRVPIAGKVTMDMTMLDVTDVNAELGDVVTLCGASGTDVITVADVAAAGQISPYEVLTSLAARLARRYVESSAAAKA